MSAPSPPKLDHMVLLVSSLELSAAYYDALLPLLGFQSVEDRTWRNESGFILQLAEARPGARPYERYGAGLNHLGFSVASPERVHEIGAAMAGAGFDVPAVQDIGGASALFLKDRDGIRIEVSHFPPEIDLGTGAVGVAA